MPKPIDIYLPALYIIPTSKTNQPNWYLCYEGPSLIEFTHVSKDFGSGEKMVRAVRDVSLTIQDGEIFGIIGFSGAGKSTLVRCINLLERPTNGTVVVDGKEMTALSPKELRLARRKIGMIFQHFNLMPSRTVFGNVAYPLQGQGLSKQAIQNKVRKLLKLVDIADKETAYPSQLSGGQKQRVAIARALANDPKVLLCDEATSALDPQTTKAILTLSAPPRTCKRSRSSSRRSPRWCSSSREK